MTASLRFTATPFIAAIFLGAFLIFCVQPMLGKYALPQLGGGPLVWNTSMVFFQALLLAGYAYAHALSPLGYRIQVFIHFALLALSLCFLPLAAKMPAAIHPSEHPVQWLFTMLAGSVSLPFLLLAATSPLLQSWFRHSGKDPYFLYAWSNAGSFIGLLAYPFIIEPLLKLSDQSVYWSALYVLFAVLILACTIAMPRTQPITSAQTDAATPSSIRWSTRLHWVALSFFPSALMLAITHYITGDIASVPLLWIIPLAIYLLTFVLAFSNAGEAWYARSVSGQALFTTIVIGFLVFSGANMVLAPILLLHLFFLFSAGMVCHGKLAKRRPNAERLTEFFLLLSLGGMLGGIFSALVAPYLFSNTMEYLLLVIGAYALRAWPEPEAPIAQIPTGKTLVYIVVVLTPIAAAIALHRLTPETVDMLNATLSGFWSPLNLAVLVVSAATIAFFIFAKRLAAFPLQYALLTLGFSIAGATLTNTSSPVMYEARNFFGTTRVMHYTNTHRHTMIHGTTLHGMQSTKEELKRELTSYYAPVREMVKAAPNAPIAAIGLGAGTIACATRQGQSLTFYEIDPEVLAIASDPEFFSYLRDCPARAQTIIGDGRKKIEDAPDASYGLIVIDAYSSDSLPVHLMTIEAVNTYLTKLKPGGILAFHISNRHFDLRYVLSPIIRTLGLSAYSGRFNFNGHAERNEKESLQSPSLWIIAARDEKTLYPLTKNLSLQPLEDVGGTPWTDDYASIFTLLVSQFQDHGKF